MVEFHKHHIIPRHAGGSDDASNLLKCNPAMHAFMHEQRFKELGDEYDRIAAAALRGQIGKREIQLSSSIEGNLRWREANSERVSRNAAPGGYIVGAQQRDSGVLAEKQKKAAEVRKKVWEVTHPDGTVEIVKGLRQFAIKHSINGSNLGNRGKAQGYTARQINEG